MRDNLPVVIETNWRLAALSVWVAAEAARALQGQAEGGLRIMSALLPEPLDVTRRDLTEAKTQISRFDRDTTSDPLECSGVVQNT
jgi:hypothetical protein